jgi:ribosomal-protein-alanine N-acetyltransferase
MIKISCMRKEDIPFCKALTDVEGWGYKSNDFRRLIDTEPEGCFVAWEGERKLGMVTTTSYDSWAFLGSLIVAEEERGKGKGAELMRCALEYLEGKGVTTMELDGVFAAASLYRRFGFRDKYLSLRFRRQPLKSDEKYQLTLPPQASDEIVLFDRRKTGIKRERLISRLIGDFPDSVYVIKKKKMLGYAIVRRREGGFFAIGPLVAENPKLAETLVSGIIQKYPGRILTIGVPAVNRDMVDILLKNRFLYCPPSLRMYRGKKITYEKHVYGILSPEKG